MQAYLCGKRKAPLCRKWRGQVWLINGQKVLAVENLVEGLYQAGLTLGYNGPRAVNYGSWPAAALRGDKGDGGGH